MFHYKKNFLFLCKRQNNERDRFTVLTRHVDVMFTACIISSQCDRNTTRFHIRFLDNVSIRQHEFSFASV